MRNLLILTAIAATLFSAPAANAQTYYGRGYQAHYQPQGYGYGGREYHSNNAGGALLLGAILGAAIVSEVRNPAPAATYGAPSCSRVFDQMTRQIVTVCYTPMKDVVAQAAPSNGTSQACQAAMNTGDNNKIRTYCAN